MAAKKREDTDTFGNSGGMTGDKLRLECLKLAVSMSNTIAQMRSGPKTPVAMAIRFEHYIQTGEVFPEE